MPVSGQAHVEMDDVSVRIWNMYEYVWNMYGICMNMYEYVWNMYEYVDIINIYLVDFLY